MHFGLVDRKLRDIDIFLERRNDFETDFNLIGANEWGSGLGFLAVQNERPDFRRQAEPIVTEPADLGAPAGRVLDNRDDPLPNLVLEPV